MPRPLEFHTQKWRSLASLWEGGGTPFGVTEGVSPNRRRGVVSQSQALSCLQRVAPKGLGVEGTIYDLLNYSGSGKAPHPVRP